NRVELAADLRSIHPEDRAVEKHILAAGQLRMKPGAHLEQARHAALQLGAAFGRRRDARQDLEQRAFSGAVAADDADDLAGADVEADVAQGPEVGVSPRAAMKP